MNLVCYVPVQTNPTVPKLCRAVPAIAATLAHIAHVRALASCFTPRIVYSMVETARVLDRVFCKSYACSMHPNLLVSGYTV